MRGRVGGTRDHAVASPMDHHGAGDTSVTFFGPLEVTPFWRRREPRRGAQGGGRGRPRTSRGGSGFQAELRRSALATIGVAHEAAMSAMPAARTWAAA